MPRTFNAGRAEDEVAIYNMPECSTAHRPDPLPIILEENTANIVDLKGVTAITSNAKPI